jgi:DNA-binding transcriptional MerR regulator
VYARKSNVRRPILLDPGTDSRVHTARMRNGKGLRSGELSRAAGVSADTLRHYERMGVLAEAPRTSSGYRIYPAGSLERVNMIRHALRLGFSLAELADVLRTRDGGGVPCAKVMALLESKIALLERHITELQCMRKHMKQIATDWSLRLGQSEPGKRVHLLHSLNSIPVPTAEIGVNRRRKIQR